jgi:hypothetical protein
MIIDAGWQGDEGGSMAGYAGFKTLLIKAIRGFLSYLDNSMSEFFLTYHCELFDSDSASGGKEIQNSFEFTTLLYEERTLLHTTYAPLEPRPPCWHPESTS